MTRHSFLWVIGISAMGVAAAASPDTLLERAGQQVKLFAQQFAAVTCTEELVQEKLNEKGKIALRSESRYDYLIVLGWDKGEWLVDESRVELDPPRKRRAESALLATRGFATLMFIFHPDFQGSYTFQEPQPDGEFLRIDFLPRPGSRSPGVLELKGREYPILWGGSAWIDPASGAIARIRAAWNEPPEALGLQALESDVHYGETSLGSSRTLWLPESAKVSLRSMHQTWRNEHRFTKYRQFSIETKDEVEVPR